MPVKGFFSKAVLRVRRTPFGACDRNVRWLVVLIYTIEIEKRIQVLLLVLVHVKFTHQLKVLARAALTRLFHLRPSEFCATSYSITIATRENPYCISCLSSPMIFGIIWSTWKQSWRVKRSPDLKLNELQEVLNCINVYLLKFLAMIPGLGKLWTIRSSDFHRMECGTTSSVTNGCNSLPSNIYLARFRENPPFFIEGWTLLRSKSNRKKFWREYEIRTYYKSPIFVTCHCVSAFDFLFD